MPQSRVKTPPAHLLVYALIGLSLLLPTATATELQVHFLAVGHGDAMIIEQAGRAIALVDAGPEEAAPGILRYLQAHDFSCIEHFFITHTHDDHIGGAFLLLQTLPIGVIHLTGMLGDTPTAARLDSLLSCGGWQLDTLGADAVPVQSDDLIISTMNPIIAEVAGRAVNPNANSLVLMLTHGQNKILLAADLDRTREQALLAKYGEKLKCQVLKASHHASPYSNCEAFLQMTAPQIAVVSTGRSRWNYPDTQTIARLRSCCPLVLRTDEIGSVILGSDGVRITISQPASEAP